MMTKITQLAILAALTFGTPLAPWPISSDPYTCGTECNGNIPGYDNPNCWPGAIYCPPADGPQDNVSFNTRAID